MMRPLIPFHFLLFTLFLTYTSWDLTYGQQNRFRSPQPRAATSQQNYGGAAGRSQPGQNQPGQNQPARVAAQPRQGYQNQPTAQNNSHRSLPPISQGIIPCPFGQLTPKHKQYLNQILAYWERRSNSIKRYQCNFKKWEFDPQFGPSSPDTPGRYSLGIIKYEAPDKGLFKETEVRKYAPPKQQGGPPEYKIVQGPIGEYWVCDGKSVFQFEYSQKQLIEQELPPEMHGKAIADGPLPFLFSAEADKIKARYWLRVITPSGVKDQYWIEAWPKARADAEHFQKVEVIIDREQWLPQAIQVFDPEYDAHSNPKRTVFQFENREYNWNTLLEDLQPWKEQFYEPSPPKGWKKVTNKYHPVQLPAPSNYPSNVPPNQAQQPRNTRMRR